jgi:hypothetical protein
MKKIITFAVLMFCLITFTFAQSEKTLVKSIAIENSVTVFDLPGEHTTTVWENDYIRVSTTISMPNNNEDFLKRLIALGRYDLVVVNENGNMVIRMPKTHNKITVKGVEMSEIFKFQISIPANLMIKKSVDHAM